MKLELIKYTTTKLFESTFLRLYAKKGNDYYILPAVKPRILKHIKNGKFMFYPVEKIKVLYPWIQYKVLPENTFEAGAVRVGKDIERISYKKLTKSEFMVMLLKGENG